MAESNPRRGGLRAVPRPPAPLTFAVGATRPSASQLREALAPYVDDDGRACCPVCGGGRVRVLDLGSTAEIAGCHGTDLTRLAGEAHAAGYLDGSAA